MPENFIKTAYATVMMAVILGASVFGATVASAQTASTSTNPVNLSSDVKIERKEKDATGKETVVLRDPKDVVVVPGDKVIFTLNVVNSGTEPASGFRATNPIPESVAFVTVDQDWAEVSVDGGASWGKLGTLTINNPTEATDNRAVVLRDAVAEDVTHVRWVFAAAIAAGSKTSVSYRGVVK